jgi:hypothetical protein
MSGAQHEEEKRQQAEQQTLARKIEQGEFLSNQSQPALLSDHSAHHSLFEDKHQNLPPV